MYSGAHCRDEPDPITALPYAPIEFFALALYFNHALDTAACQVLERMIWTQCSLPGRDGVLFGHASL
jgi:hypothetical protein